jgi:type I restriction enzyme S subunit
LVVPAPPLTEQREILNAFTAELDPLAESIKIAHDEIHLLREYRTRLIADVVTGKLDVRAAAARLPDETEEFESLDETDSQADTDLAIDDDFDAAPEVAEA